MTEILLEQMRADMERMFKITLIMWGMSFIAGFFMHWLIVATSASNSKKKKLVNRSKCFHRNKGIYVEETAATCEKITITCLDCGKKLSTKTEC